MVRSGTLLPKKLKRDSIVEAVGEFRFDTQAFPEVFLGRFVDHLNWKGWRQRQLPAYNIPAQIRLTDPNVKFSPIIELAQPDSKAVLRIGPSVVSYHRIAPYVGWAMFKPELERVAETLFDTAVNPGVRRIGLRYMNALQPGLHYIKSVADLDVQVVVSEDIVTRNLNINYTTDIGNNSSCTVRIATKEFVQGALPETMSVFVDVDVFTNEGFSTSDRKKVTDWIEFAHMQEKTEFFRLFKQETIDQLREA